MLAYVHRMPCREDDSVTAKDLSKVRNCVVIIFLIFIYLLLYLMHSLFMIKLNNSPFGDVSSRLQTEGYGVIKDGQIFF